MALNKSGCFRLTLLIAGLLALAACRDLGGQSGPSVSATLTPTPRSTPLPAVPTPVPPGDEGNAIQMVIRPLGPEADARSAAADFEDAVLKRSGVVIEVRLVDRYAEGLAALCESAGGQASVAWLNGAAYAAARARNCGVPALQVERGTRDTRATGMAGSLIVPRGSGIREVRGLNNRKFCRLGSDDFYSWLVPSLMLRASSMDPISAPASITDYADVPALIRAVAERDCDAAGIAADALETYAETVSDVGSAVTVLATTIPFPYAILMIPPEAPLGKRLALANALLEMAADRADALTMRSLLAQDALVPATVEDFTELMDFMNSTRLDFAQLGN